MRPWLGRIAIHPYLHPITGKWIDSGLADKSPSRLPQIQTIWVRRFDGGFRKVRLTQPTTVEKLFGEGKSFCTDKLARGLQLIHIGGEYAVKEYNYGH